MTTEQLLTLYSDLGQFAKDARQDGPDWYIVMAAKSIVHAAYLDALHPSDVVA